MVKLLKLNELLKKIKKINSFAILIILVISTYLFAKTDVIILSDNVGTEIDVHENRFYRIFPEEKDLISAQILKIDRDQYRLMIVKEIAGERKRVRRYLTRNELDDLKMHVDEQPEFTKSQNTTFSKKLCSHLGGSILGAPQLSQAHKK